MPAIVNLDRLAAEYSQKMVSESKNKEKEEVLERLVTKSLGVLQEQGVYAMILFLFSRSGSDEKETSKIVRVELYRILERLPAFKNDTTLKSIKDSDKLEDVLKFYSSKQVMEDIDNLFFIRDLYEQTLIYARYGAKASKEK